MGGDLVGLEFVLLLRRPVNHQQGLLHKKNC